MLIWNLLTGATFAAQVMLALPAVYLCALAIAAMYASHRRQRARVQQSSQALQAYPRFVVLVPAHNEESMIGTLLRSLQALTYPRESYTVYVVADNCADRTAEVAGDTPGVQVIERTDPAHQGKGYALEWALHELAERQISYDACVVLDADSVVEAGFLQAFAGELLTGAQAAQACNTVLNPLESASTVLRWVALTLMNHVRPLGRNALGASSTLTGNGMCLTRTLLDRHPWRAFGVAEDYEYYLGLVLEGERVRYVPEAVVSSHMPTSFAQLQSQDIRWESGSAEMGTWKLGRRLLWQSLRARDLVRLEAVAELATPPLSSLVGFSALSLAAAVLVRSPLEMALGFVLLAAIAGYCVSALYVLRPPRTVYRMLAFAPLYMARKLWVRIVLQRRSAFAGKWVRTARPVETEGSTEPTRIAQVTFDYYPFDVRVRRLAEAAVDGGYAVDVICLRESGERARETCHGVDIYRLPQSRGFGGALPLTVLAWCRFLLRAAIMLTWLHLRRRYDVVHVHNMPDFLVFCALVPKLLGARVILDVQDVSPELMAAKAHGRRHGLLFRLAAAQEQVSARFADAVVTVGWPFEQLLLRRGVPQSKLSIILNSADPRLFPPSRRCPPPRALGESDQPIIVIYWGTLAERNGLDLAIQALALARESVPGLRLDIMGRGEQMPALKQLASALGLSECVCFSDPVPGEQIVDFVLHGDIGIIPYRSDGFADLVLPTKAYELAWMGRPIIAADTPAIRSMFRPESIRLCTPGDARGFAEAIVELAQDAALRERLVANAATDYTPYRWQMMSTRYQDLLRALSRHSPRVQDAVA
jgi:glycosyltransferase involved in cell wall biosynthesis